MGLNPTFLLTVERDSQPLIEGNRFSFYLTGTVYDALKLQGRDR